MRAIDAPAFSLNLAMVAAATLGIPPPSIPNSQLLRGPDFAGNAASASPLEPKPVFEPDVTMMHYDTANTGVTELSGPLGVGINVDSATQLLGVMLWGDDGTLTGGRASIDVLGLSVELGLAAYNPENFAVLSEWFPTNSSETINLAYMSMRSEDKTVVASTMEGTIVTVQRHDSDDGDVTLELTREIDVRTALQPGELLLNTMFDAQGNIWFTTGELFANQSSATIGVVTPSGTVRSYHMPDQAVENGVAVNGTDFFVVTGPQTNLTGPASGYVWSFTITTADGDGEPELELRWKAPYDAGSEVKPGGLTRGSGGTPTLLGAEYVATTDNADGQISLVVFHREPAASAEEQVLCSVPLFEPGRSSSDNRVTGHPSPGGGYGLLVQNNYGAPPPQLEYVQAIVDLNGDWNDMSSMPGGIARVDVSSAADGGGCAVRWANDDITTKSVPSLSASTGLFYTSVQDKDLASEGKFVWYVVAIDWETGEERWRKRTGAGGTFNDNWQQSAVSPQEGNLYQAVFAGTAWIKDGSEGDDG